MMLKTFINIRLVVVFLIADITSAYAQQKEKFQFAHQAIYKMTYLSDSLDLHSQEQQMTELLIGDGTSLFRSSQKAYDDSSYMAYINTKVITMNAPQMSPIGEINAFNYQIVKDYTSGQIKVYDEYTGSTMNNLKEIGYYFEPEEAMSQWTLKNDTSTINGHLCQRADIEYGGRKWTAWFSPEVSAYADGPYKFRGLPGLIFRVYDAKKTWDFELVELSKIDTTVTINFKDDLSFVQTTKEQLYKNRRHYQKNQMEITEADGADFGDDRAGIKNKLEEYIQQDDNWIELGF